MPAFPKELVAAIASRAALGAIGSALLVTFSGTEISGVGLAFWGVVAGAIALLVQHYRPRNAGA